MATMSSATNAIVWMMKLKMDLRRKTAEIEQTAVRKTKPTPAVDVTTIRTARRTWSEFILVTFS